MWAGGLRQHDVDRILFDDCIASRVGQVKGHLCGLARSADSAQGVTIND